MQMNPIARPHTSQGCLEMDTNWQQETWSAMNHLVPVMPEVSEKKHIVQYRDKFNVLWLAPFPQRTKPIKDVVNIVSKLLCK